MDHWIEGRIEDDIRLSDIDIAKLTYIAKFYWNDQVMNLYFCYDEKTKTGNFRVFHRCKPVDRNCGIIIPFIGNPLLWGLSDENPSFEELKEKIKGMKEEIELNVKNIVTYSNKKENER